MNVLEQDVSRTRGFAFWSSPKPRAISARIAVAGDFLPGGKLAITPPGIWSDRARALAPHFKDVAISFANLETVLDASELAPRPLCGLGDIVSAGSDCLDYLETLGARVIGIANNHSYDFGSHGVARTRHAITQRSMVALGAGRNLGCEPEVSIWQGPGSIRVGFWAAARATFDSATRGAAGVEPATAARSLRALELMKRQGATFCVALLHAGCLRACHPAPEDRQLMDRIAENGFDVVAASHSHRISGAKALHGENGRRAFCFYGLGSLVSGYVAHPLEREGLVVVVSLDPCGALAQIEVRPVLLAASGFGESPSPAESRTIFDRFLRISAAIENGSYEREFYREVSNGLLQLYIRDAHRAFQQFGVRGLARKASRVRMSHMKRLVHKVTG